MKETIDGVLCSKVEYTGNNIYFAPNQECWPQKCVLLNSQKLGTYLPWIVGYGGVDDDEDDVYDWYRSSARAVWEWKSYEPANPPNPTTWTKYYDGSPTKIHKRSYNEGVQS